MCRKRVCVGEVCRKRVWGRWVGKHAVCVSVEYDVEVSINHVCMFRLVFQCFSVKDSIFPLSCVGLSLSLSLLLCLSLSALPARR